MFTGMIINRELERFVKINVFFFFVISVLVLVLILVCQLPAK